ncbi:hypothetical protein HB364_13780 [Pseudoflavitalea sp. X16]|uniref:hypothetical protein n=1 Tax=Paraflavitalea devenefica TaxID=2716334 RepID=UPI00141DFED4|nr:hypothetical protein [Paraflavitalea devenefica]NII26158.1 hypothetical protein [Paraflavitalea devenefica]
MDKITQDINAMAVFMRQKGYTGNFTLEADELRNKFTGDIRRVLTALSQHAAQQETPMGSFILSTFAQYNHHQDYIKTQFYISHEPKNGFVISQQHFSHNAQYPTRMHIASHHQVLGSQALINRYPKPKPWDDLRKGRPWRPGR